ncbi:unnamed protein product [Symbiodinium microadriaticum]|nr:unnamed protein product [Symbiodinium microadriaticum]
MASSRYPTQRLLCTLWSRHGLRWASSTASFLPPPKRRWSPPSRLPASLGFASPELRKSRSPKELNRRAGPGPSAPTKTKTVPPEASPRKKGGKKHRHSTDLEELSSPSPQMPAVPRFGQRQAKKLAQRPVAALPRTPQFFVRFGPPMTAEDLTHDAPSVLVESRKLIDDVLERRDKLQSAPDYVAPDTPFWRVPAKRRNKKGPKWEFHPQDAEDEGEAAPEQLQGIVDLGRNPLGRTPGGRRRSEPLSPSNATSKLLRADEDRPAEADVPQGPAEPELHRELDSPLDDAAAGAASVVESGGATRPSRRPEDSLIAALRRKATEYAQTGVDPELLQSLSEALQHHPGTERAARLREMQSCEKDFEALVMEGKASVANINELIRAQALQGRMADAMQTHDAMKLHGYAPDAETFVSLLAGAAHQRNADLARKLFLKMREQLISATPKVYATLIQAHVRAGDTASGYALLRKMEDESIQPDVVVHTVLINGLVNEGRIERAWEEFHAARTWKLIQPDEVLFTVMIKACAIMQEAERALNLLDDLRTCGLYPTDITYGEIIHAVSTTSDHARKAFDFYRQMQAEDLPVSAFVFEHLLQACRHLGDAKRAKALVEEMGEQHVVLSPVMYNHLVGLFATAMRRPHVSDVEKLQNLRHAWGVVSAAREAYSDKLDWTSLLNEIVGVYVAGGFSDFAMDMLPQYAVFGAEPDAETWEHLLRMLGERDIGRFFTLWNSVPKPLPEELYQVALDVALRSRSSQQTCAILEEMYTVPVFPSPQLTERLARAGRHIIQIHHQIGKFIALNRDVKVASAKRETALLQTHMDERDTQRAAEGLTVRSPTPEQEFRDRYFDKLKKQGVFRRPWLPFGEYLVSKQKGGEAYARRHDKPRPNLLATSTSSTS